MRILKLIFVLVLITHSVRIVQTWGCMGHMLTAQISELELQEKEPEIYNRMQQLIQSLNPLTNNKSHTLVESACWPDDIRGDGSTLYNTWHYINKVITNEYKDQDTPQVDTILDALKQVQDVLINPQNARFNTVNKCIMTRFLIHLLGDIHQPLHNVALYSPEFPNGDQGGNLLFVQYQNMNVSLHKYWDDIAFQLPNIKRPMDVDDKFNLVNLAQQIVKEFPRSYFNDQLNNQDPNQFSEESYQLAQIYIYNIFKDPKSKRVIDEEKAQEDYKIMRQRLALGGYRLTDMIMAVIKQELQQQQQHKI